MAPHERGRWSDGSAGDDRPRTPRSRSQFGLPAAIALIMGSIIGVGIFNLPTSLAPYGPITLVSMGLTTVGALVLAVLFGALSRRLPADGGPYAYARVGFGNPLGFDERLVVLDHRLGRQRRDRRRLGALRRALRQQGPRHVGVDPARPRRALAAGLRQPLRREEHGVDPDADDDPQVLRSSRSCRPSGSSTSRAANYTPWNVSIGVDDRRDRKRHGDRALQLHRRRDGFGRRRQGPRPRSERRPRATLLGTLATAAVYMLSLLAIFGILSNAQLQSTTEPFSAAANAIFGGTWAGDVMADPRDHLGPRRAERLDDDLRRDAARRRATTASSRNASSS